MKVIHINVFKECSFLCAYMCIRIVNTVLIRSISWHCISEEIPMNNFHVFVKYLLYLN